MKGLFSIGILMAFVGTLNAQKFNFSGNWQLDQQRTELGSVPSSAASTAINVSQQKDSIIIERIGVIHVKESLPISGAPATVSFAGGKKLASIVFNNDGTSMQEIASYKMDSTANPDLVYAVKSTETWTLLPDRSLQILRIVELANSESYSIKTIYTKQDKTAAN